MNARMKGLGGLALLVAASSTVVVVGNERTTTAAPVTSPVAVTVVNPDSQPVPSAIDPSANVVRVGENMFNARVETGLASGGNETQGIVFPVTLPSGSALVIENINWYVQQGLDETARAFIEVRNADQSVAVRRYAVLHSQSQGLGTAILTANDTVTVYVPAGATMSAGVIRLKPDGTQDFDNLAVEISIGGRKLP